MAEFKAVLFDQDGTLYDTVPIHLGAINDALREHKLPDLCMTRPQYEALFTGVKARTVFEVLKLLHPKRAIDVDALHTLKQRLTIDHLAGVSAEPALIKLFTQLKHGGARLAVVTSSPRPVSLILLERLGITPYIDLLVAREDVTDHKPSSAPYREALRLLDVRADEALAVEDGPIGRASARGVAGLRGWWVAHPSQVTPEGYQQHLRRIGKMRVVVPMAGRGSRFVEAGYSQPKPLITFEGKPMIQHVVDGINLQDAVYVFICQRDHYNGPHLEAVLRGLKDDVEVRWVDGITEGATCTLLTASDIFDTDEEVLFVNSDQRAETDIAEFVWDARMRALDGSILTFETRGSHLSYARDADGVPGFVADVAEKREISTHATAGYYYWRTGKSFVMCANAMIRANERVNGEFYLAPTYNKAIQWGLKVGRFDIGTAAKMREYGSPEQLLAYLRRSR